MAKQQLFMTPKQIGFLLGRMRVFNSHNLRSLQYLILAVGLAAMMAMTVPRIRAETSPWLEVVLWCCLAFFAGELAVKIWASGKAGEARSRLLGSDLLIDFLSVLPIPCALLAGVPAETAWLLASLWVLSLPPFLRAVAAGADCPARSAPLASVFIIFLIVLLLASVALYSLERASQPEQFGSLPLSLWWAVTTLTTTGYGDAVPQTFFGRLIAGIVMICGLGVFGLWTGILATGFATEHRRREFIRNWDLVTSVPFLRNLDAPAINRVDAHAAAAGRGRTKRGRSARAAGRLHVFHRLR